MLKGFKMKLFPGMENEYKRRHNELWPEMRDMRRKVNRNFKNNSEKIQVDSRSTKRAKRDKFFRPKVFSFM